MGKKPKIGVMPLLDSERDSLWMIPGYMEGIIEAGGAPVMLPLSDDETLLKELADMCDAFLFTGGQDVSPSLYGEEKTALCGEVSPARDKMDAFMLKMAIERDKAALGICRGIQLFNAVLGGTLWQDIPSCLKTEVNHHQKPPYDVPAHSVAILPSPLRELLGVNVLQVNSYHHQGVKTLSPLLKPMAVSEDNITEAAYMPGKRFIWAVQWHPELSFKSDEASRAIFGEFVRKA